MARKRIFATNKFNGGMTNDVRDTSDLSKTAFISHLDIYGDPHEAQVMPGFVNDMEYAGVEDGMKDFRIRTFWYDNTLWCAGTRADGTGTKIFYRNDASSGEWLPGFAIQTLPDGEGQESDFDIIDAPRARAITDSNYLYVTTTDGTDLYFTEFGGSTGVDDTKYQILSSTTGTSGTVQAIRGGADKSGRIYFTSTRADVLQLDGETFSQAWDTGSYYITGITESARGFWTIGYTFQPYNTEIRLWDRNSALADMVIPIPNTRGGAIGVVGGTPIAVVDENMDTLKTAGSVEEQQNGLGGLSVQAIVSGGAETLYRFNTTDLDDNVMVPCNFNFKDSFVFYADLTLSDGTTKREGIWAVGRHNSTGNLALSLLMDTSSLGIMNGYYGFGNQMFIAHGTDWQISKLDNYGSGSYDVPATIETLMYGGDTPLEKHLNGITVKTTALPSGGSVAAYYRTAMDDSWTLMGTSSTAGTKSHSFTKAEGSPVGAFEEIQFKLVFTGKMSVSHFVASLEEHDNLPHNI